MSDKTPSPLPPDPGRDTNDPDAIARAAYRKLDKAMTFDLDEGLQDVLHRARSGEARMSGPPFAPSSAERVGVSLASVYQRVVVGVDVEGFSKVNARRQLLIQAALDEMLTKAAQAANLNRDGWDRSSAGDGEVAVLPGNVDLLLIVRRFVTELDQLLADHNQDHAQETRLRLRIAMNLGSFIPGDSSLGDGGDALIVLARLLDSQGVRKALQEVPEANLAQVVSESLFQRAVVPEVGGLRPSQFRKVEVTFPAKGFRQTAYLYVPGGWPEPGEPQHPVELAQFAGQTVATAAVTDAWDAVRGRFARLLGRGDARRTQVAEEWLAHTRDQLTGAGLDAGQVREAHAERWAGRFADLLDEDPSLAGELRTLVDEVAARLPGSAVSTSVYSVAAGRDVHITASGGGTAAGVIHGNVTPPNPTVPGPGPALAGPGGLSLGPGSVAAFSGGTAIGTLKLQRREVPGLPVRLAPRPTVLVGREQLLADIGVRLAPDSARSGTRFVVLCGLGGAGKSSAATEYAYRQLGEAGVCWQFAAEDPTVLAAQFGVLAAQLGAREVADARDPVAAVHAVLARSQAGWLVIFDNVMDLASVEAFLPPAGPGRVLITSQSQHWPAGWAVQVPVLDPVVAAQFLIARAGDGDQGAALELAAELGGLPLALEQAAAYMQATGTALGRYLGLFRERQADLLARGEAAGHREHVAATLGLALVRMGRNAPAAGLLRLLAFLAPEPVPLGLLLTGQEDATERLGAEAAKALGPMLGDPVEVGDAVAALRRYSLAALAGDGLVQMHRLVQAVTRSQLTAAQTGQWKQAAATLVEAAIPADGQLPTAWSACAVLLPHALSVLDLTSGGIWRIAQSLGDSGSYAAARDLFVLIADAHWGSGDYGPEHPRTLISRLELARETGNAGDAAGARDQFAALLPVNERVLGPEHLDTLNTRFELAYWTGDSGDAAGARDRFAALLPINERVLGPEHPRTLITRYEIARWTGEAGDAGDAAWARDQFAALLPTNERVLGPEHPRTLITRHEIARWTGEAGNAAGARDLNAALLPIVERVLGPEHPYTLLTRESLARWTGDSGDAAGARDRFAALLPINERVQGPEHPRTLAARHEIARWTGEAGDAAGARDEFGALLALRERVSGREHPHALDTRHELARWTGEAGDAVGAQEQFAVLLSICERVLGAKHLYTLKTRNQLARWTEKAGGRG